ncbi:hypothetical protein Rcae01_01186 [Novipirellula caenicola]|uniref:Secreted protein n=1 Tax=Novipirellula caenicola TaxID=1536901 RepID=A0ABP9VKM4_9BACT
MVRTRIFQFTIVNLTFSISSTNFTRPAKREGSENEPSASFPARATRQLNRTFYLEHTEAPPRAHSARSDLPKTSFEEVKHDTCVTQP